jgi:shikimate dehydrogenase
MPFAEVIGDPIAQSKSPIIHKYWLKQLGIESEYVRTQVAPIDLVDFIGRRRADPRWCGCNVTIPHKQAIMPLADRLDPGAEAIGAVNCVIPEASGLAGYNTDIDGVAAALDSVELEGRKAVVIGAGGGARAVVAYLAQRSADIVVLARNPAKADELSSLAPVRILPLEQAVDAFEGAAAVINATSMGMAGADPMSQSLLAAVRTHTEDAILFDMVTTPADTEFLACGDRTVDGLTMLIGQARRAFELFFGSSPPQGDAELRRLLTGADQ